jgi:hypothetical protein
MDDSTTDRRNGPRVPVEWQAECRLGDKVASGVVRDVSGGGVFFTPILSEQTLAGRRFHILSFLEPGDTVVLTYQPDWQTQPLMVLATVSWVGFSRDNDADGAGLCFQE